MSASAAKDVRPGCVVWLKAHQSNNYGVKMYKMKLWRTHRLSWALEHGPIPDGLCVLHKCDNPPCFNVDHLFLGTLGDNSRDMTRKGRGRPDAGKHQRAKTHCRYGHPFDEENTRYRRTTGGGVGRVCRACHRRENLAAYHAKAHGPAQ